MAHLARFFWRRFKVRLEFIGGGGPAASPQVGIKILDATQVCEGPLTRDTDGKGDVTLYSKGVKPI